MTDDYRSCIERADGLRAIVERARCQVGELDDMLALTERVSDAWTEAWNLIDRALVLATVRRIPVARVRAARRRAVDAVAMWRLVQVDKERHGVAIVAAGPLREAIDELRATLPARVVRVGKRRNLAALWMPLVFAAVGVGAWLCYDAIDDRAAPMVKR